MTPEELMAIPVITDVHELHRYEVFSGICSRRYSEDKESTFIRLSNGKTRRAHPRSYARSGVDEKTGLNSWTAALDNTEKKYY